MKIKELIEELSELNPEFEYVIARDEEGNGFSALDGFGFGIIDDDSNDDEGYFSSYDEDDNEVEESNATAICFWP